MHHDVKISGARIRTHRIILKGQLLYGIEDFLYKSKNDDGFDSGAASMLKEVSSDVPQESVLGRACSCYFSTTCWSRSKVI